MTIQVDSVSKSFDGKPVLTDFCMEISDGNSYLLTGPSGSGKTTLLRILLGLEKADSGKIRLLGDYKYSSIHAGTVFQEDRLCEAFSAVENVAMVSRKLSRKNCKGGTGKAPPRRCPGQAGAGALRRHAKARCHRAGTLCPERCASLR